MYRTFILVAFIFSSDPTPLGVEQCHATPNGVFKPPFCKFQKLRKSLPIQKTIRVHLW